MERRARYRVDAAEVDNHLRLWLEGDGDQRVGAEIIDLSRKGVALRIPADLAPAIGARQQVLLHFQDLRGQSIPAIRAQIRSVVRTPTSVRYGLAFATAHNLAEDLPGHLLALFNRRAARRIAPPQEVSVELELEPEGGKPLMGRLRDISWSGAGVELPACASLGRMLLVELRFQLPGIAQGFQLKGHIQHDLLIDDVLRLGIHFDAQASEGFPAQQSALKRYVARCYLERKRAPRGEEPCE